MVTSFWKNTRRFPPILCRILARRNCQAITTAEIAVGAGMTPLMVDQLSQQTDWRGVDINTAHRFLAACRMDFCDAVSMRRARDYLSKAPTFTYLKKSPLWSSYYVPLLKCWRDSVKKGTTNG